MAVSPPRPSDFPLAALRALEAAARHGGFAAAAVELGVSPAAITAHVKGIEARIGCALFDRETRGVRLTEAGRRALPALTEAFDALEAAAAVLRHEGSQRPLAIAALPALAQLWLPPRLAALEEAIPGLAVSITAMEAPPSAKRGAVDLTLFYGPGGADVLVPVAAPGAEMVPRLTDAAWREDWARWQSGAPDTWPPGQGTGPVHSLYALALEDAFRGRGVLMGRLALIAEPLAAGRLVELGPRVPIPEGPCVEARNAAPTTRRASSWLRDRLASPTGDSPSVRA